MYALDIVDLGSTRAFKRHASLRALSCLRVIADERHISLKFPTSSVPQPNYREAFQWQCSFNGRTSKNWSSLLPFTKNTVVIKLIYYNFWEGKKSNFWTRTGNCRSCTYVQLWCMYPIQRLQKFAKSCSPEQGGLYCSWSCCQTFFFRTSASRNTSLHLLAQVCKL